MLEAMPEDERDYTATVVLSAAIEEDDVIVALQDAVVQMRAGRLYTQEDVDAVIEAVMASFRAASQHPIPDAQPLPSVI
jgi:uncharacterized protein YlzI (FlbEa/FlbD family)